MKETKKIVQIAKKSEKITQIAEQKIYTEDITTQINNARDLINNLMPDSALIILEDLKDRVWSKCNGNEKFRILNNIGAAKLAMDNITEAIKYFREAYIYDSNDLKAKFSYALSFYLVGDKSKASLVVEEILKEHPENIDALSLKIKININNDETTTLQQMVPAYLMQEVNVLHALSFASYEKNNFEEAIFWGEKYKDKDIHPDFIANLGHLYTLKSDYNNMFKRHDPSDNIIAEKAIAMFDKAIEKIKDKELFKYRTNYILEKAISHLKLGEVKTAIEEFKKVLILNEKNIYAKRNLGTAYLEAKEITEAIKIFEEIKDLKNFPEVKIILSDLYRLEGEYDNALQILDDFREKTNDKSMLLESYRITSRIYLDMGNIDKSKEFSNKASELDPNNQLTKLNDAIIEKNVGNIKLAEIKLLDCYENINEKSSFLMIKELASALYDLKKYKEASFLFEKITNINNFDLEFRKLVHSYYMTKEYPKVIDIGASLRKNGIYDKHIIDMECFVYEKSGDLENPKLIYNDYLNQNPHDFVILIQYLELCLRRNDIDEVKNVLNEKEIVIHDLPLDVVFRLASLYGMFNFKNKFLSVIYETRRQHFDKKEAHLNYIGLMTIRSKNPELLNIDFVSEDTVVFLKNKTDDSKYYIIENRENPSLANKELNLVDPIALKLMNKKLGDSITFGGKHAEDEWEITEIKSKYVFALHESLKTYHDHFEDELLMLFKFDESKSVEENFDFIIKGEYENRKIFEDLISHYQKGLTPIHLISKYLSRNILDVQLTFMQDSKIGIMSNFSSSEDVNRAKEVLDNREGKKIILDITSLNLIYLLDLGELFVKHFGKFGIAQTVVDEIRSLLFEREGISSDGFLSLVQQEGELRRIEITKEEVEKNVSYLRGLLDWIEFNCEILSFDSKLLAHETKMKNISDYLGEYGYHTLLLAYGDEKILFSEDMVFKKIAFEEFNTTSIWSQSALIYLLDNELITRDEYNSLTIKIAAANIHYTIIDHAILLKAAEESEWQIKYPFLNVVHTLRDPNLDLISVISVTVEFIKQMMFKTLTSEKRTSIILSLLDEITVLRNKRDVITRLKGFIRSKFKLLPLQERELFEIINIWERTNLI